MVYKRGLVVDDSLTVTEIHTHSLQLMTNLHMKYTCCAWR